MITLAAEIFIGFIGLSFAALIISAIIFYSTVYVVAISKQLKGTN